MSLSLPTSRSPPGWARACWSRAGAAGISFVAVAMASGGADLSDDTGTAVGPATIYSFMLVGGLFNLVLVEDAADALRRHGAVRVRGMGVLAGGRRAGRLLPGRRDGARAARAGGRRRDDADRLRARRPRAARRRQDDRQGGVPDAAAQRIMLALQALLALLGVAAVPLPQAAAESDRARRGCRACWACSRADAGRVAGGRRDRLALPPEAIVSAALWCWSRSSCFAASCSAAMQEHYAARAAPVAKVAHAN